MADAYCSRCQARCGGKHFVPDEYESTPEGGIRLKRNNLPNPGHRRTRVVGLIPGYMTEARYFREGEHTGYYRHNFSPKTKVRMYAMSDGSVLLKGRKRIHADDRRPGFDKYTRGNPGGGMEQKDESQFTWFLVLGFLAYWFLTKGVSGAFASTGVPVAMPSVGNLTPQYGSSGAIVGYYKLNSDGSVSTFDASGNPD